MIAGRFSHLQFARALRGAVVLTLAALCAPAAASADTLRVAQGGSVAQAFRAASPGDVIEVQAGSYGSQDIPVVSGRGGPAVEVRPAAGAAVTFDGLDIAGSYVTVRGIRTGDVDIEAGSTVVQNVTVVGGRGNRLFINNARHVTIRGGSYGGVTNFAPVQIGSDPSSQHITFDGVDFHDAVATDPNAHLECVWAGDVQHFTVRNSLFRNCAYFGLFITHLYGTEPRDVLIENNVFERTFQSNGQKAPYAMMVANWLSTMQNFTFRNNTFETEVALLPPTGQNVRMVGNIGIASTCHDAVRYAHNVWTSGKCDATDRRVPGAMSQFIDRGGHNWRLTAGAAAIDAADPGDAPATDRDGLGRAGRPDAGAHEFGGTSGGPAGGGPGAGGGGTTTSLLTGARLARRYVCVVSRPRCRRTKVALRVRLAAAGRITVRIRRPRSGRIVRTLRKRGHKGVNVIRIGPRGLVRGGRYRVTVVARDRAGRRSPVKRLMLRVR